METKRKIAIIACFVGFITTIAGFVLPRVFSEFFAREESNVIIQLIQSPTIKLVLGGLFFGFLGSGVQLYMSSADNDLKKPSIINASTRDGMGKPEPE